MSIKKRLEGIFTLGKKEKKISEIVNLKNVYRVKGFKSLYYPIMRPTSSRRIGMRNLATGDSTTTNVSNLTSLGQTVIFKQDGTHITLGEAFDNIKAKHPDKFVEPNDLELSDVCPDYDEDKFKRYHLIKIADWYNQINSIAKKTQEAA